MMARSEGWEEESAVALCQYKSTFLNVFCSGTLSAKRLDFYFRLVLDCVRFGLVNRYLHII